MTAFAAREITPGAEDEYRGQQDDGGKPAGAEREPGGRDGARVDLAIHADVEVARAQRQPHGEAAQE